MKVAARQQEETLPAEMQQAVETETAGKDAVPEDDATWQQLETFARHKIALNTADEAVLQSLGILTPLLINNLLTYRRLLGNFVSIYELQAVPGFERDVIQKLLPYVQVGNDLEPHYSLRDYLRKGEHVLLFRYGRTLEKAKGYLDTDSTAPHYHGSPDKVFIRYRYNFPRYISWGITMEKDAGEAWFKYPQQQGFDFYSAHLFIRNRGKLKALAIGDYTVNMGQGLLNWQSQAYGKGAAVMQVKREGDILRPYTGAGEYYFFRGAAVTLQQRSWQLTLFVAHRKLDGTINMTDSVPDEATAAAIVSSGYHRADNEIIKRGTLQQLSGGGNVRYSTRQWQAGVNMVYHHFDPLLEKERKPYNQFDFNGQQLYGSSFDYAGSWKNVHLFGEAALGNNGKPAIVQGLLTSVAPAVDLSLVYRYYDKGYQSMYAQGFGDNYRTVNERGLYTGLSVRINACLKLDGYADIFHFPWLKFRADAPSSGRDMLLQLAYTPDKQRTFLLRYSSGLRQENLQVAGNALRILSDITTTRIRFSCNWQFNKQVTANTRIEYNYYQMVAGRQQGWLFCQDLSWRFRHLPLSINGRLARFITGGYDTRIYTYERSVLYENAVSQLYGQGWLYYLNVKWKINKSLSCWWRLHQAVYPGQQVVGSGWEEIPGNRKTMVQVQLMQLF